MLSVQEQLRDGVVLVSGGTGFLASCALEKLLRSTEVKTVFLLVRGKKGVSAAQRVEKLLCGPLFHLLHKQAAEGRGNVFGKVQVVEGDMDLPGLGLSPADTQRLVESVTSVMHCAADLTLDAHIQQALRCNYCSCRELLALAGRMQRLRAFAFCSTYWVNNFLPYNTPVKEQVHNIVLQLPGETQVMSHAEFVERLLAMPADEAASEAAAFMARINFVSTYGFSKVLTEQMVNEPDILPGVSKVIIRPSLISNTAGGPYPGYVGGFAGSPGYCLAYGLGFFHDISSIGFSSDAVIDIIPCDTVAMLLIAAVAGATAHGPWDNGAARVYHACSAESHPESSISFFHYLHTFWSANPPPFKLPGGRYPEIVGRHAPTVDSLLVGQRAVGRKVWAVSKLLALSGKPWKARSLRNGFKAFCVQNTLGYARSIMSCVDNVRELQASLVPAEQAEWRCIWETGVDLEWETYAYTILAGLRCLAFKVSEDDIVTPVPHLFKRMEGLSDPSLLHVSGASSLVKATVGVDAAAAVEDALGVAYEQGHGSNSSSSSSSSDGSGSGDCSSSDGSSDIADLAVSGLELRGDAVKLAAQAADDAAAAVGSG